MKITSPCLPLVMILALVFSSHVIPEAHAAKTALKIASLGPKGLGWAISFEKYVNPWLLRGTNDQFVFKTYWGGIMGNDDDYLRKMKINQLQGAGLSGQGSTQACREFSVVSLPFLFNSAAEVDHVRSMMFATFDYYFTASGYKLLLWLDQDFDLLYSSKHRFDKLEDFRAARIVTWYGPQEANMLRALGASPIPVAVTDVPSSRRSGIIDTDIAPAIWQVGSQLYTIDKYVNTMKIRYSPATLILSNTAWEQIPEKSQDKLMDEQADIQNLYIADIRRENERCLKAMLDYGVQQVTTSPAAMAVIQKRAMTVYADMSGNMYPVELLKEISRYLDAYRKGKPTTVKASVPRPERTETADKAHTAPVEAPVPGQKLSAWEERKRQILEVQKILKGMGLYDDEVDGIIGPNTREAVMKYQKAKNLAATGAVDKRLLRHMGIIK